MRSFTRVAAALTAVLMLLVPALWNRFPLLQFDTGGYIARWYEGTLEESRSTVYGLFLNALTWPDFWPVILVQAALTVWILSLVLRVHGPAARPLGLLITVALMAVLTTLPWIVDVLLTDIFAGLSVLALYLMVLHADSFTRLERGALALFVAFSAATHSATLLVLVLVLMTGVLAAIVVRGRLSVSNIAQGFAALALSAVMIFAANYAVAGRLAWTPGGPAIFFGRMMEAGIVARYLDDHCPDPRLRLCAYRQELPRDADEFFWGKSVFVELGRFQGLNEEMRIIVLESLVEYPWLQIEAAVTATAQQLVQVRTGYGVIPAIMHTHGIIEQFVPGVVPAMQAARQQQGKLDFTAINLLHVPVAWGSMLLLLGIIGLGIRCEQYSGLGWLAACVTVAILGNAVVCGALSNPHDRYGARMVWLATLVLALAPWCAGRRKKPG